MALNLTFPQHLEHYADTLERVYKSLGKAQPEDQLKAPVARLLEESGLLNQRIELRTEQQVRDVKGRPDMGLLLDSVLSGYLELKAPGLGANPKKFDERSKAQFEKFRALPNLLYTDGLEWALYRSGERVGELLELGDVLERGKKGVKADAAQKLSNLLQDYLSWQPITPRNPRALAEFLAPLCRMVRDDVTLALEQTDSALSEVATDWRKTLFPDADNARFADSYAQTLTYALLLARLSGAKALDPELAAKTLDSGHGLLAGALRILGNPDVKADLGAGLDVLIRCIEAVDPAVMTQKGRKQWGYGHDENYPLDANESEGLREDPWLYFYEDFLGAYDRKLRNDYGVYYTPTPVILCQIKLVESLLKGHFGKALGFAEEGVTVLDPAAGTGAYPLAVLSQGLANVETAFGAGMRAQYATQLAQNIHAFEFLVGPYAVAHLRITQKLLEEGGNLPKDGVHVYLTDTLENPDSLPLESAGMMYRRLSQEHTRAQKVKKGTDVLVCIGNPPYDRQERSEEDKANGVDVRGGWVRFGAQRNQSGDTLGIFKDFVEPAEKAGRGDSIQPMYNDYVYFWRWALWKVLEQKDGPGIISFITASSYVRGPGFLGMRELMRRYFDYIWIIDLEGDSRSARN